MDFFKFDTFYVVAIVIVAAWAIRLVRFSSESAKIKMFLMQNTIFGLGGAFMFLKVDISDDEILRYVAIIGFFGLIVARYIFLIAQYRRLHQNG